MKRILIIIYALCFLCFCPKAQETDLFQKFLEQYGSKDVTPCEMEAESLIPMRSSCGYVSFRGRDYAPLFVPSESDSVLKVRLNLIFIQKDDGTGNFRIDNEEEQSILDDAIADLNRIMSSLLFPGTDCFDGTDEEMIHDTRIRFIDHRYYVKNSRVWNNGLHEEDRQKLCPSSNTWYLTSISDSINNSFNDSLKGINIFFTEDSIIYHHCWELHNLNDTSNVFTGHSVAACSMFPSYSNWQMSSRIHEPCLYSRYWWMKNIVPQLGAFSYPSWESVVREWLITTISRSLVHELGHSFYLYHPIEDEIYNSFYPNSDCFYSIMNPSGTSPRFFLPPNEIGRIYINTMTTNLQQYIPSYTYLGVKNINSNVSFPQMHCFYSLHIGSSGNVTIPCNISFPIQGYIKVLDGGELTVSGALLQSVESLWGGITVQSGGKLVLSNVTIGDYNIVVKSGGLLVVDNDLTIIGDHSITIENGGAICVTNNATIDLVDEFSTIVISKNAILGCLSCNEVCISSLSGLSNSGNGHIITYEGTEYIQNMTISSDYLATGDSVYAGYDVTSTKPVGSVVVDNGGNLRIKAYETVLTQKVEVKSGGTLTISK